MEQTLKPSMATPFSFRCRRHSLPYFPFSAWLCFPFDCPAFPCTVCLARYAIQHSLWYLGFKMGVSAAVDTSSEESSVLPRGRFPTQVSELFSQSVLGAVQPYVPSAASAFV